MLAGVSIQRASLDRLHPLAALLGRAFVVEPMMRWSLGDHGDVAERFTRYFEHFLERLLPLGAVWEAGTGDGAAVWLAPDELASWEAATMDDDRTALLTLDGGRRYAAFWEWVESRIPDEPLWHLDSVAVRPDARGRGIGGALIEHGLARARGAGVGSLLETANPGNLAYYQRLGFAIVDEATAPDGGPTVWFMRCDA
jgi:ribosomal protein S18 acetylase RimI-like enzyme